MQKIQGADLDEPGDPRAALREEQEARLREAVKNAAEKQ